MALAVNEDIVRGVMLELAQEDPYSETSTEFRYECPFCHSSRVKFYISKDTGLYICFNCSRQGSLVTLVKDLTGLSFTESLSYLQDDWQVDGQYTYTPDADTSFYTQLLETLDTDALTTTTPSLTAPALPTNTKLLMTNFSNPEAFPFFNYLKKRGLSLQQIKQQQICYVVTGTFRTQDKENPINNSIIFPTFNEQGQMIYWNSRSIEIDPYIKSINAPALENEYSRKDVIYNLNQVTARSRVVVCEGVFNALTVNFPPTVVGVATFGKNVTDKQIQLLRAKDGLITSYYLFLDEDARVEQIKLAQRMNNGGISQHKIYLVNNHSSQDANDLGSRQSLLLVKHAKPMTDLATKLDFLLHD